ncbi:MAG: UDP-N-acetylglucosamine--N-acetylmuramyl-(pentapeptide) pyrophosphoryl-undecaprenol N-acetylglucosamine transferase [Candidatus Saccharibacteria bacterium]|nr:UDP-N-acetylglucosamine--N-acetylmuramyl-(pentapeptide) pyrophosphoryl-undecaprenol N-acetylglucosamine transferase [Candidatus Saccharibacteria bacterium]
MKILCVGGGSGGHITPIVAVLEQLESPKYQDELDGQLETRVWCDRKFAPQAHKLLGDTRVDVIVAGKLRRYANLKWWYRWFSPYHIIHTHIPNLIDLFKIAGGFVQSLVKLKLWRPDVVFCKGGYVSLPVGIVAHWYHIPLVIHDSDTVPGLTNRVLARYADAIGTGAPVKNYPSYPKNKTKYIGVPVQGNVKHISKTSQLELKRELGLTDKPFILAMGGGLGSVAINNAVVANAKNLAASGAELLLLSGKGHVVNVPAKARKSLMVQEFSSQVPDYEQVADIVITRAGATTMAELATVGVATIIIPSPYLSDDHQTKNAMVYAEAEAAIVLNEFELREQPELLWQAIDELLSNSKERQKLAGNLHREFARPRALDDMIDLILSVIK